MLATNQEFLNDVKAHWPTASHDTLEQHIPLDTSSWLSFQDNAHSSFPPTPSQSLYTDSSLPLSI